MNASMQQLSTSNISSARTQCEGFGSRLAINKLPSNRVPSMWRLVVLQNRLTSAGANSDSDLRMRLDGAHGIAPRLGELNWSSMIGLPTDMDLSGCTQIDCCAVTPPVNVPIVSSRRVESDGALEFGERYRAMLAEAAHDIRAPLGVARQILNRIVSRVRDDSGLSNQDRRLLASADERLEQAATWVDGILLPNRLQHVAMGTLRQRFYPHQLRGIVEPVVNDMASQRDVVLDWVGWDRSLPRLYLDPNQLGRVLLNLISNAISASPRGSRLSLRIDWQINVTQRLVIAVEDEGPGLPASLLRFVNSAQLAPAPAEAGIGLATVKSLMNAIGGSISAQVGPLGGTLYRLTVPVDNRLSLVRSWLLHQSQQADRGAKNPLASVQLHMLCSTSLDTAAVDRWLQQVASPEDFVYRVSEDRWLWLSADAQAPTLGSAKGNGAVAAVKNYAAQAQAESGQLNWQLTAEWHNVELKSLHSATDQRNLLPQLAAEIADKFASLTGNLIPPINELKDQFPLATKAHDWKFTLLRVDELASQVPKAKLRPAIPDRLNLLTADPAMFAELAHDWREQHS